MKCAKPFGFCVPSADATAVGCAMTDYVTIYLPTGEWCGGFPDGFFAGGAFAGVDGRTGVALYISSL